MMRRSRIAAAAVCGIALVLVVMLGWSQSAPAQGLMRPARGGYGEFGSLLGKHGEKSMLLEVHIANLQQGKGEVIGKLVQSTETLLVLKAQNQRDLYFITWDDVIWITARPN
ncbi:MAG: hypothetical protein ACE5EC_05805 [Phycisphaerae bacterium]